MTDRDSCPARRPQRPILALPLLPLLALLVATAVPAAARAQAAATLDRGEQIRWQMWEAADRAQALVRDADAYRRLDHIKDALEDASDAQLEELAIVAPFMGQLNRALGRVVDRRGDEIRASGKLRVGAGANSTCEVADYTAGGPFPVAPYPQGACSAGWADFLSLDEFCPPGLPPELSACGDVDPIAGGSIPSGPGGITGGGLGDITALFDDVKAELEALLCSGPKTVRQNYQTRFDVMNVSLIAELIGDVAGRLCEQQISVLDIGGNLSFLCIPVEMAFHVTEAIEGFNEICDGLIDSAEIEGAYERAGHVHDNLTSTESAIATLDSDLAAHDAAILAQLQADLTTITGELDAAKAAILTALAGHDATVKSNLAATATQLSTELGAHDADIKATLAANATFFLQTSIERALSREQGPTSVYRLASFYLPAAQGGQLARVREVVLETIDAVADSGESPNTAMETFLDAESTAAGGDWKGAWDLYSEAYRQAVACRSSTPACRR